MTTFFLQRNWDGSVALNEFVCWFYEEILRERKSDGNSTNEKSWWFQLFEEPGNKLLSQRTTLEMAKSSVLKCYMWKVNFTRKMKNAQLISMSLYLRQPCKLSSVKSKEVPLCCSNHIPHILAELSLTEFFNRKRHPVSAGRCYYPPFLSINSKSIQKILIVRQITWHQDHSVYISWSVAPATET